MIILILSGSTSSIASVKFFLVFPIYILDKWPENIFKKQPETMF